MNDDRLAKTLRDMHSGAMRESTGETIEDAVHKVVPPPAAGTLRKSGFMQDFAAGVRANATETAVAETRQKIMVHVYENWTPDQDRLLDGIRDLAIEIEGVTYAGPAAAPHHQVVPGPDPEPTPSASQPVNLVGLPPADHHAPFEHFGEVTFGADAPASLNPNAVPVSLGKVSVVTLTPSPVPYTAEDMRRRQAACLEESKRAAEEKSSHMRALQGAKGPRNYAIRACIEIAECRGFRSKHWSLAFEAAAEKLEEAEEVTP